jgi:hypothetical protein
MKINTKYTEKDLENMFSELKYSQIKIPEFKGFSEFPKKSPYNFSVLERKTVAFLFAVPTFMSIFALTFYFSNPKDLQENKQIALLQESNNRILQEISTLEK